MNDGMTMMTGTTAAVAAVRALKEELERAAFRIITLRPRETVTARHSYYNERAIRRAQRRNLQVRSRQEYHAQAASK